MTVPTSSNFLLRFPEFGEQSLSVTEDALAEAGRFTSTSVWGTLHTDAVSYLAAHILASRTIQIGTQIGATPGAVVSRDSISSTLYGQEYQRLLNALPLSGLAL